MARPELVLPLVALDGSMLAQVGGKAANLGVLLGGGFPVPTGFCVTTAAFPVAGDMLDAVRTAILAAYAELGNETPVAVRSSATAEDLPFASFAGQHDTFLDVAGPDAVLEAVRRCWASLQTDRAVAYRAAQQIEDGSVRLAVVVQRLVRSAVAGVLFTANPVTGRRREAVIDAAPGLGEAVVSGAVNPDHFVVDTVTGRLLSTAGDEPPCLSVEQIRRLAALGDRVERHFGAPQDIEWAIDADGAYWLTQSRPITTLFPLPTGPLRPGRRAYFCFSVAQGLNRPITPMGLAAFRLLASGAAGVFGVTRHFDPLAGPPAYAEAGSRVFVDLTGVLRSSVGRQLVPRVFDLMESRSAALMRGLFDAPEFAVTQRSPLPSIRRAVRLLIRYRIPVHLVQALISPAAAHRRAAGIGADVRTRLAIDQAGTPAQRLAHAQRILSDVFPVLPQLAPAGFAGFAMLGLAAGLLRGSTEPGDLQGVLRGVPHNVTIEMDLELWALAERIRTDPEAAGVLRRDSAAELATGYRAGTLPARFQRGLAGFLTRYGHRAVAEIDLGVARWSDDPTHLIGVLQNYLRQENADLAPDQIFRRSAVAALDTIERLAAQYPRWRRPVVRFALTRARELAGIRELPKNCIIEVFAAARHDLQLVGAALVAAGKIDQVDDIFFLDLAEAAAGLAGRSLQPLVAERRADHDRELRRVRVPRIMLSDGTLPENLASAETSDAAGSLRGVAASPGVVTGVGRVILDPIGAQLEPGEILIAPSTDPGWTPLFLTAGGLVMEMGGANSHGAVVAREYGIPAVVGVPLATERIASGDLTTVNGTAGTVTVGANVKGS